MADSASSGRPTVTDVTKNISQVLWKIHELEATLATYDASTSDVLEQRLVQYERLLATTRDMLRRDAPGDEKTTLQNRTIPEELVKALDGGVNPDEYLRETFKACRRDNQIAKGKSEALQLLHANALTDAADVFPAEAAEYKKLLGL